MSKNKEETKISIEDLNLTPTETTASAFQTESIDLSELRLSQDFEAQTGVKQIIMTVPVRKPHGQEFIRVRSGEEWQLETAVIELKDEGETYLVHPSLRSELADFIRLKIFFTTINTQGIVSLWGVNLGSSDGRVNEWNRSALEAANKAKTQWIQVRSNRQLGAYVCYSPINPIAEPEWSEDLDFAKLINIAFKDRYITSLDHPVVGRLRGGI
jgi:hypothetical protein